MFTPCAGTAARGVKPTVAPAAKTLFVGVEDLGLPPAEYATLGAHVGTDNARVQCSGTPDSGQTVIAYAVGG
ncbi:MAG: hypothetical protein HOO96_38665 [Polyangiaceae bacterium]|nr:hypothetical protein [Polyangiaceae bacterium]